MIDRTDKTNKTDRTNRQIRLILVSTFLYCNPFEAVSYFFLGIVIVEAEHNAIHVVVPLLLHYAVGHDNLFS